MVLTFNSVPNPQTPRNVEYPKSVSPKIMFYIVLLYLVLFKNNEQNQFLKSKVASSCHFGRQQNHSLNFNPTPKSHVKTLYVWKSNQRNQIAYMPSVFQNDRNLYNHITTTTNKKTLDLFCLKISILCWTQVFIPYKSNPKPNSIRFGCFPKTGRTTDVPQVRPWHPMPRSCRYPRCGRAPDVPCVEPLPCPGEKSRSNLYDLARDSRGFLRGGRGKRSNSPKYVALAIPFFIATLGFLQVSPHCNVWVLSSSKRKTPS